MNEPGEDAALMGEVVVLDVRGSLSYLGQLKAIGPQFYELVEADVHDFNSGRTSKDVYLIDALKHGVKKNRHSVLVRLSEVVSLSRLQDVVEY